MRDRITLPSAIRLLLAVAALLALQLWLHWYGTTHINGWGADVKGLYEYHDPDNNKPYGAGLIDFVFPALFLGLIMGITTRNWPTPAVVFCVVFGSLTLVGLESIYNEFAGSFLSPGELMRGPILIVFYMKVLAFSGFFTGFSRTLARHYQER